MCGQFSKEKYLTMLEQSVHRGSLLGDVVFNENITSRVLEAFWNEGQV